MTVIERPSASARDALLVAARAELDEHGGAVSLRAIARRAGVSHAAPKYFFDDRAGLLTAVATAGFRDLTARLRSMRTDDSSVASAGRVYFDFGLDEPALFDLMFRASDLHQDAPALIDAKTEALAELAAVVGGQEAGTIDDLTLGHWAFAHGLVVLAREQALGSQTSGSASPRDTAYRLLDVFSERTATPAVSAVADPPRRP